MLFPPFSQLHLLNASQQCTGQHDQGLTGDIQPFSPWPLSWVELNTWISVSSTAPYKQSQTRKRVHRKRSGTKTITSREATRQGLLERCKMLHPPSLQSCFWVLKHSFQEGLLCFPHPWAQTDLLDSPTTSTVHLTASGPTSSTCCRYWWCKRLQISGTGHLEQPSSISPSHQHCSISVLAEIISFFSPTLPVTLLFSPSYCLCCYLWFILCNCPI